MFSYFACSVVLHAQMQGELSCMQTLGQHGVQFWAIVEHRRVGNVWPIEMQLNQSFSG